MLYTAVTAVTAVDYAMELFLGVKGEIVSLPICGL
jgi:hypothetical protein